MSDESSGSSDFNKWWIVAGGGSVLVLVALVLILTGVLGGGNQQPATETAPGTPSENSPPPVGATVCEVPGASDTIPTAGPAANWQTNVYFLYPTSSDFGPTGNPSSDVWGCFQKSPTGALFAAANLYSGLFGDDYADVAIAASVSGPALDRWLAEQASVSRGQTAGKVAQVAGFQFLSTTNDAVTVNLGLRQNDIEAFVTVALTWDETTQNWQAVMSETNFAPTLGELDAYTPWSAS